MAIETALSLTNDDEDFCPPALAKVLRAIPVDLQAQARRPFPLLDALHDLDKSRGSKLAHQLILISAAAHRNADERRTAEYLLRHRGEVVHDRRSARSLFTAAFVAAEMDLRRDRLREIPTAIDERYASDGRTGQFRVDDPSVGELVIDKLQIFTGRQLVTDYRECLLNAITIALELAERHRLNGGKGPSLIAMRADARPCARLATRLRDEFANPVAARRTARLLVGSDGSPIHTALLWWCAFRDVNSTDVGADIRRRWMRDINASQAAVVADWTLRRSMQAETRCA